MRQGTIVSQGQPHKQDNPGIKKANDSSSKSNAINSKIRDANVRYDTPSSDIKAKNFHVGESGLFCVGLEVDFLIDSGACISIISNKVFDKIPEDVKPELISSYETVSLADGRPMEILGLTEMTIQLENIEVKSEFYLANISCDAIIGIDFFRQHGCRLDFISDSLYIDDKKVQCRSVGLKPVCCRVVITETTSIPAGHEIIVQGKLIRRQGTFTGVIENTQKFVEKHNVLIGRSIVENHNDLIPLRIMNPNNNVKVIHENTTAALLHPVKYINDDTCKSLDKCVNSISSITKESKGVELPEYLKKMYDDGCENLSVDQAGKFAKLLVNYVDVFASTDKDIGRTNITKHTIDTGNAKPIKQRPRRLPIHKQGEVDKLIDMIAKDIIESSSSPWSSPITLATKKDGSSRFCLDFRSLNEYTVKDAYPLPRIDDSLDTLSGAQWFSTMDLASGYWQVEMDENNKVKTAFSTKR